MAASVVKCHESKEHARSMKIDRILTGKYTALPMFLVVMFLTFYLTFNVIGQWLSDLLQLGIDALTGVVDAALTAYGINPVVHSLIIDGVFAGVGSVLVFLPIIVTLFFFLSILEDTGYMARVAFVMDKPLRKIGLSGRSVVPMLIGFGCSVPAIMATRTVSSDRDRKMTILLTPYMSCSAKISIYAFFTAAFFPRYRALVMIGLYVLGILIGILAALIMNKTAFRGKPVPFVMELPNYRMPGLKSVALLLWEKAKDFLQRAFTVIFLATIIIWFLQSFDTRLNVVADSANSLLALIGQFIAPIFAAARLWRLAVRHGAHLRLHRQGIRRQHAAGAARRRGHFDAAHHALGCQLPCVHAAVYAVRGRHRHHPPRVGFPAQDGRRRGSAVLGRVGRGACRVCDRGAGVMRLIDYLLLAIVAVCAVIAWRVWRRAMKKGGCCGSGCTGNCAQCGRNCDCKKEK